MPFCTQCGRQIEAGQKCTCTAQQSGTAGQQHATPDFKTETGNYVKYAASEISGSVVNSVNTWKEELKSQDAYERGFKIVPDSVNANEGEIPIRQYDHIARLRSRSILTWAEGKIQVTNKRLIFRAPGRCLLTGRQALQHEIAIDDISGVEFKRNFRFIPLDFLFAYLLIALGVSLMAGFFTAIYSELEAVAVILGLIAGAALTLPLFMLKGFHPYIKLLSFSGAVGAFLPLLIWLMTAGKLGIFLAVILSIALGVVLFIRICKVILQPNLAIVIRTKSGIGAVTIRHMPVFAGLFGGNGGLFNFTAFEEVQPGRDTDRAIKELGAIIHDVQTIGDKAVEKWGQR